MDAKNASQQLILAKSSAAPAAGLFALSYADGGPTRTAVLRGQRQRDVSLWTPIHRLRAGRGKAYSRVLRHSI